MSFIYLNQNQYRQLTENCQVIKTRRDKPVILERADHLIIKHIYHRGGWSSSRIWPYAKRFAKNSYHLQKLGVLVPVVDALYRVPHLRCDIVTYPKIEGMSVREHWHNGDHAKLRQTAPFLAQLHELGIYFRDLHLANILVTDTHFALIDLASIKCQNKPLNENQRIRNFNHLFRDFDDGPIIESFGVDAFLEAYNERSQIPLKRKCKVACYY